MARMLGILVNMKNMHSAEDERYHQVLAADAESRCFPQPIPHMVPIQHAARYRSDGRSYTAKFPGSAGEAFRAAVQEIVRRLAEMQDRHPLDDLDLAERHADEALSGAAASPARFQDFVRDYDRGADDMDGEAMRAGTSDADDLALAPGGRERGY
jgi:hypothetical protein